MLGAWLYAGYINWLGVLVGAVSGAGRTTPVAAAGAVGTELAETAVLVLLGSVAAASFIAVALSLWGLRSGAPRRGSDVHR